VHDGSVYTSPKGVNDVRNSFFEQCRFRETGKRWQVNAISLPNMAIAIY
jgi:hypothetical protein